MICAAAVGTGGDVVRLFAVDMARGDCMSQIVSGVRRLLAVTRDFVLAACDDRFWEGCGQ